MKDSRIGARPSQFHDAAFGVELLVVLTQGCVHASDAPDDVEQDVVGVGQVLDRGQPGRKKAQDLLRS